MLIGSFSSYDVEDLLITFAAEKYPTMADRLFYGDDEEVDDEESLSESKDDVKIYGLTRNDRPNQKVKSITVNDVLHFRPLTQNKIEVLLEILENGMMQKLRREVAAARTEQGHCEAHWINVGCMMPWMDYTPRTLDEIIEREKTYICSEAE